MLNLNLANKMLQEGLRTNGLIEKEFPPISQVTQARLAEEMRIKGMPNPKDEASKILVANKPVLDVYIMYKGEKPHDNPLATATQATILRANDIAYIAASIDGSDLDGLTTLEDNESHYKEIQNAEAEYILPPAVQASMKILMQYMKASVSDSANLTDVISYVSKVTPKNNYNFMGKDRLNLSVFDMIGNVMQDEPLYNNPYYKDQVVTMYPDKAIDHYDGPGAGVFAFVDKLFTTIGKGAETVGTGIDSVKDKVKGFVNNLASDATRQSIKDNLPIILGIILVLAISIFAAIRFGKSRNI